MKTSSWRYVLLSLVLILPVALRAQAPPSGFFPWWDGPVVNNLNLTDSQRAEIRSVIREYRGRLRDVREAVQRAETDLDEVFNEDNVDQRRGAEAIDRLTKARAEMTKSVSELSLRMRSILTPQQWQELRQRQQQIDVAGRGRGGGRGRRGPKNVAKDVPKGSAPRVENAPALSQQ
jgi:Spy/CpxP family protein refolding chaperone